MTDDEAPFMALPNTRVNERTLPHVLRPWLESIEEHDPESFARLGGGSASMDEIIDLILEEQTPETTRNLLLAEYDKTPISDAFKDAVEEKIMGYLPPGYGLEEYEGHAQAAEEPGKYQQNHLGTINNTSSNPLFRRSNEEIFDQVWDAIKSNRKEGFSKLGNREGVHSQIKRPLNTPSANIKDRRIERHQGIERPGVRVPPSERTLCSNLDCNNKLRHRMGTAESMIPKLCGRCTRLHGKVTNLDPSRLRPTFDMHKGKFRGYSKDNIGGRAERQGKARAWNQSRRVKRKRNRQRYARDKKRGNVRPRMRRQLGAGGSRKETKR